MRFDSSASPITSRIVFLLHLACASVLITGCSTSKQLNNGFVQSIDQNKNPWSHDRFQSQANFQFAITSDLYGGGRDGIFEVAVEQINLLHPSFIMSVGDLIDGGHEDEKRLHEEWDEFDSKAQKANAPFFYVGGNHDLTNVTMRKVWNERLGPRYYHFVYNNVLFLVLDSEDYSEARMKEIYEARAIALDIMDGKREGNPATADYFKMQERRTGHISSAQSQYFANAINANPDVDWTFLFMHKPVWMGEGEGNLSKIESALERKKYTLFNGHFHTYAHQQRKDADYIMLGTTGGAQNDKSDMAFDHFTIVTMTPNGPSIANLKLEGVLDKEGSIPLDGEERCFQASKCKDKESEK